MQPALGDDLLMRALSSSNVLAAWKRVKANRGSPGLNGISIDEFAAFGRENWPSIRKALLDGSYRPSPMRRVMIPKSGSKGERQLQAVLE